MEVEKVISNIVKKMENRYFGKFRGFVVDNADPKKIGRLKVRVPSVFGENVVTGWAMPCLPYGGLANQGLAFIPENGAGVWVEFEEGDLEFPIWVGTFYGEVNGESEWPKTIDARGADQGLAGAADVPSAKIIKTKSGHAIILEDDQNKASIRIKEGLKKHLIVLDDKGITLVSIIEENVCQKIIMNTDGITVETTKDVNINGNNINIRGKGGILIDATGELRAKGSMIHLNPP